MIIFKPHQAFDHITPHLPEHPIIVEAGAFTGQETEKMALRWPHATIHAFEPVPDIFAQLIERTKNLPNVHCYNLALSTTTGTATFYISEKPKNPGIASQAGALQKPKERLKHSPMHFPYTIQVQTITLDAWAQQYNINHVDLLWLDMQGHELAVMQSAPKILKTVSIIHTEVGFIEAYENQPLYEEVKTWLESQGFTMIGKDFTDQKKWFFGNGLFIKK
jgi:FkbM family methyltransferase